MSEATTDISTDAYIVRITICEEMAIIRSALTAPSVLFKPRLFPDGDMWCALFGENLQEGVAGFGETPESAMAAFDSEWRTRRLVRKSPCPKQGPAQ